MHQICYREYDLNANKRKVKKDCDNYCIEHSDYGCGLSSDIQWKDKTFNSYEEACDYLEDLSGDYDAIAVKYKDIASFLNTKVYCDLKERLDKAEELYKHKLETFHFNDVKAKFISCKNCQSKFNLEFFHSNYCPICKKDLRPQTTLKQLDNMKNKVNDIKNKIKQEEKAYSEKIKAKWLVMFEFHC